MLTWAEALALGERAADPSPDPASALSRDDVACFIYTSGTGGNPKGVILSQGNLLANVAGAYTVVEKLGLGNEVFLSFLPLSHAYEHTVGQFLPIAVRGEIYYAEGTESLTSNLLEVRPTIMTCVPRLYEVMRQRILNALSRRGGLGPKLFAKAVELGSRKVEQPGSLGLLERLFDRALDRLVREQVKSRFGGRIKALVSGGAPLNYDVGLFFAALGLPVFQGYGLTECSPIISVNLPGRGEAAHGRAADPRARRQDRRRRRDPGARQLRDAGLLARRGGDRPGAAGRLAAHRRRRPDRRCRAASRSPTASAT